MATVVATLTVDFTANYAGPHRVCFRIQGSGNPYDCSTTVGCVGGGSACQAVINTPVNTTSCDGPITFEGYIQAACEDILSTSGRLAFTAVFVPNVVCEKYEVLCARGPIDSVTITQPGNDYILADTLALVRNGADPETSDGALSIGAVGDGVINTVSGIAAAGINYTVLDVLNVVDNTGIGTGATIRVDSIGGSGEILTFTLLTNGTDYTGGFSFTGGTGTGASFTITPLVDYNVYGSLVSINVDVPGSYSIPPTVVITTGTGSEGILEVVLTPCTEYINVGVDCIGGDQVDIATGALDVGETFGTCIEGGLAGATPAVYDVTQTGCCIPEDTAGTPCTDHHIENASGGPVDVHVTHCDGDDEIVTIPIGTTALCLVADGYIDPDVVGVTITDLSTPCT